MTKTVHMLKLSVGTEDVAGLNAWQNTKRSQSEDGLPRHITRMWPKRSKEILILCRQPILRLDEHIGTDGIRRCAICCKPGLIRVEATPKRAFQGWRYLTVDDAPRDLPDTRQEEEPLPPELSKALAAIGVR